MLVVADAALPADGAKDVVLAAVFRALLATARRALNHVIKEIIFGSGTGVGLAHCLQHVPEAEAHEIDDVEGVACILDALRSTSVDSPNAAKIFIRDVSIVIKDTVVLKCTCAVGHRNRDAFLAHLSQAFGRPLPCHLEAELLNSYEQNFTGLEGAFLSVTKCKGKRRPRRPRCVFDAEDVRKLVESEESVDEDNECLTSGHGAIARSQHTRMQKAYDCETFEDVHLGTSLGSRAGACLHNTERDADDSFVALSGFQTSDSWQDFGTLAFATSSQGVCQHEKRRTAMWRACFA
jgi:hypothetical protein